MEQPTLPLTNSRPDSGDNTALIIRPAIAGRVRFGAGGGTLTTPMCFSWIPAAQGILTDPHSEFRLRLGHRSCLRGWRIWGGVRFFFLGKDVWEGNWNWMESVTFNIVKISFLFYIKIWCNCFYISDTFTWFFSTSYSQLSWHFDAFTSFTAFQLGEGVLILKLPNPWTST